MLSVDYSSQLTESVRDARLPATFRTDGRIRYTIHTHAISYQTRPKHEVWVHKTDLAQGGFGFVQLQSRVNDQDAPECRVIKSVRVAEQELVLRRAMYIRELDALAKFSHAKYSDFFVKFHGWYDSPGWIHIVMEYCELGDLQSYLNNSRLCANKRLPENQARQIASQLTDALSLMHGENFAHRDLKPANVLIKRQPPGRWWVKLCDLGLSKRIEDAVSIAVRGTPGYMPPELLGFTGNPKANPCLGDLWCLGELIYQTLAGQATFKTFAEVGKYCSGTIGFPVQSLQDLSVSEEAVDFIKSLMAFEPSKRISVQDAGGHVWLGEGAEPEASETLAKSLDHSECPLYMSFEHNRDDHTSQWTTEVIDHCDETHRDRASQNGLRGQTTKQALISPYPPPPAAVGPSPQAYPSILLEAAKSNPVPADTTPVTAKRVRALHDFIPSEPGELEFKKGDIITVLGSAYKDWWRGSLAGKEGIFPLNYVHNKLEASKLPAAPSSTTTVTHRWVRALHHFIPTELSELEFKKGDVIFVLESVYKQWWRGSLGGKEGIFPVNYIEKLPALFDDADMMFEDEYTGHMIRIPPLDPEQLSEYVLTFKGREKQPGIIIKDQATQIFLESGLSQGLVAEVWNLIDPMNHEELRITQCIVAHHLLTCIKTKALLKLPRKVPDSLVGAAWRYTTPRC